MIYKIEYNVVQTFAFFNCITKRDSTLEEH